MEDGKLGAEAVEAFLDLVEGVEERCHESSERWIREDQQFLCNTRSKFSHSACLASWIMSHLTLEPGGSNSTLAFRDKSESWRLSYSVFL